MTPRPADVEERLHALHDDACDHVGSSVDAIKACPVPAALRAAYCLALEDAAEQVDQCSLFNEGLHRAKTVASVALDVAAKRIRALAAEVQRG